MDLSRQKSVVDGDICDEALWIKHRLKYGAVRVEIAGRRLTNSNKPREQGATDDRLVASGSLIVSTDKRSYEVFTVAGVNGTACKESCRAYSGRSILESIYSISGITAKSRRAKVEVRGGHMSREGIERCLSKGPLQHVRVQGNGEQDDC